MEKKLSDFNDYEGVDASLETSLYEYGLIWKEITPEGELLPTHYHFIYGDGLQETESMDIEYNLFDWADIPIDCNPVDEWDWVKWSDVAETSGMSKKDFLKMPLTMIVFDLIGYYGHENIFGASYYPFEIINE
jgi:hypothetical protein